MLKGLQNLLEFINNNWSFICVIIALIILIWNKAKAFFAKSDEEKIAIAMATIRETMLKFITEAEMSYETMNKSGSIKRAQVIDELFKQYPILSKGVDQDQIVAAIDEAIDSALPELRKIIKENLQ